MDAEPYGLQREMLLRAEFGADGHPTAHRYPPVHELLLLRGLLDTARMARAVRQATEGVDALRGRLRACGGGTVLRRREDPADAVYARGSADGVGPRAEG
jgi:hypothetical protein